MAFKLFREGSNIQIPHIQRIVFDELPPGLDLIAHQRREHQIRLGVILGADLQQRADGRVHRGRPQLVRVHLAQPFVTVDGDAFLAGGDEVLDEVVDVGERGVGFLATTGRRRRGCLRLGCQLGRLVHRGATDAGLVGAATDATAIGGAPVAEATRLAAESKDRQRRGRKDKPTEVRLGSLDELVDYLIAAGKKGVAINRYKGLGEMNPDTLWATTMNPEIRTLLQVRAEDHAEADQMFTTLMGDQVEPRRKFIEDNALDVRNLDV